MKSIRVRIAAIIVSAVLACVVLVFAASYPVVRAENDRNSVSLMNLIGRDTQKSLEKYLNSIEQSIEMAANIASDSLDSVILLESGAAGAYAKQSERTKEQTDRLDEYLAGYCARLQTAFATIASHTHGVITYYYCINPEISQREHGFFYSKVGKTGFDRQEPLDARELDPEDRAHTTWYFTPIQRGRPSWVGPYKAAFLNEMWIYSYLVPIYKAGALIGVMGMDISCDTLINQVSTIRVYETGYACLLDADGKVLYHPSAPFGSRLEQSGIAIGSEIMQQESSGEEMIRYTANGKERLLAFFTLSNGMKLLIGVPVAFVERHEAEFSEMFAASLDSQSDFRALGLHTKVTMRPGRDMSLMSRSDTKDYLIRLEGWADISHKDADGNYTMFRFHAGKRFSPRDELFVQTDVVPQDVHWTWAVGYTRHLADATRLIARYDMRGEKMILGGEQEIGRKWMLRYEYRWTDQMGEGALRYRLHDFLSLEYIIDKKDKWVRVIGNF